MTSTKPRGDDDYFNDLSRQPNSGQGCVDSPPDRSQNTMNEDENGASKPKRIACVICRKRKLKCDGSKPSCGTCSRLGHNCAYDEIRRKSGPKRGYVKELEARLAQVETQLKTKAKKPAPNGSRTMQDTPIEMNPPVPDLNSNGYPQNTNRPEIMDRYFETSNNSSQSADRISPAASSNLEATSGADPTTSWDVIGLGLEEPLPTQQAIDELHNLYFEHIHPSAPMIHKYRYRAAMNLAPHMRPPVCLRYIMWCFAASISDKYHNHQDIFYRRARKYAEADEMKMQGENFMTVGHAQAWVLISSYEFKMMYFPRAWMSVGRACRMVLMLGLNRMDGVGLDVKRCIPPPRDWTDREERRRTFWMAYCVDRYASIGTGWPVVIDERDIMTNLPASEEAYEKSYSQQTLPLNGSMGPQEVASLSTLAGVVFMAHFFGLNLNHLHRPEPNERDDDLQGGFWKRHRKMDNTLLNTSLALPSHLRLPSGVRDANVVFLNMNIHTSTICLHQAAIYKAESNGLSANIIEQCQTRCLVAAAEIATIMRLISHLDSISMNPFVAFCLYVAARVFVQFLKKQPDEEEMRASLEFLLNSMNVLKRRNPLSESFLMQLSMDMEGTGLDTLLHNLDFSSSMVKGPGTVPADFDAVKCSPLLDIRKTQTINTGNHMKPNNKGLPTGFPNVSTNGTPNLVNSRATQFNRQNINLASREQRAPQQHWSQSISEPMNLENILPNSRWASNSPSAYPISGAENSTFDTSMSDNTSEGPRSSGQTPSTTNHASSNTSYSPPQDEDLDLTLRTASHHPIPNSNTAATPGFLSWSPAKETAIPPTTSPNQAQDNTPFVVPQGWQLGSETELPDGLAGLSPPGDGGWAQMLEGVLWDGSGMGMETAGPWTPRQGPAL